MNNQIEHDFLKIIENFTFYKYDKNEKILTHQKPKNPKIAQFCTLETSVFFIFFEPSIWLDHANLSEQNPI